MRRRLIIGLTAVALALSQPVPALALCVCAGDAHAPWACASAHPRDEAFEPSAPSSCCVSEARDAPRPSSPCASMRDGTPGGADLGGAVFSGADCARTMDPGGETGTALRPAPPRAASDTALGGGVPAFSGPDARSCIAVGRGGRDDRVPPGVGAIARHVLLCVARC